MAANPKLLCDTSGMDRKTWLEARAHGPDGSIPYTIGGSDIGVIFGVSPFKTALELWHEKKGNILPDDNSNAAQKKLGHVLEDVICELWAEKTGNTIIQDTGLYQHGDYPCLLANLDRRFIRASDGKEGPFDAKSTSYRMAHEWDDGAIPMHYEFQIRHYMAVKNMDIGAIGCLWGNNPGSDLAVPPYLERDFEIEKMLIEGALEFVDSLHHNREPSLKGVPSKQAMKALARIAAKSEASLPTVILGRKYASKAIRIARLDEEIAQHNKIIKGKEDEIAQLSVQICEAMKKHGHGSIDAGLHEILLHYVEKTSNRVDTKRLAADYPIIHKEMLRESISRKLKVEVREKTV